MRQQLTGRWINGPRFLTLPEEQWPVQTATPSPAEHNMERRNVNAVSAASQVDIGNVIDPKVFTSWRKLIRITAWLGRLTENIRSRRNQLGGREGLLTPEELAKAEMSWIRSAQRSLQRRLENGEFKTLSPFVDGKGIIRVGGRIDKAIVSYEQNISHMHNCGHPRVATTTAKSRRKYWVLKANELSKAVLLVEEWHTKPRRS